MNIPYYSHNTQVCRFSNCTLAVQSKLCTLHCTTLSCRLKVGPVLQINQSFKLYIYTNAFIRTLCTFHLPLAFLNNKHRKGGH